MKDNLLVIVGPTAVGKTGLSLDIATRFNGEIISGDSMQVYKGLDIGTAKISPEEMRGVKHHLINCYEPDYDFSVAEFQDIVQKSIVEINRKNKLPILVGGTGLYIKSVTNKYNFSQVKRDNDYREHLSQYNNDILYTKLNEVDPLTASKIHINDTKRILRALEVYHLSGKPASELLVDQDREIPYNLLIIGLIRNRAELYNQINLRVDNMINQGLVEEVKSLLASGYNEKYNSMQGLGYKEINKYLKGEISLEHAIFLIKQGTRRYAKRQLSWFRQIEEIHWFDLTDSRDNNKEKNINNIFDLIAGKF
ncbi:MAG: tRNA (adenosine(37)-N6)-dimethylallyltransferase MiaA [Vulcanibacillus sp.]